MMPPAPGRLSTMTRCGGCSDSRHDARRDIGGSRPAGMRRRGASSCRDSPAQPRYMPRRATPKPTSGTPFMRRPSAAQASDLVVRSVRGTDACRRRVAVAHAAMRLAPCRSPRVRRARLRGAVAGIEGISTNAPIARACASLTTSSYALISAHHTSCSAGIVAHSSRAWRPNISSKIDGLPRCDVVATRLDARPREARSHPAPSSAPMPLNFRR